MGVYFAAYADGPVTDPVFYYYHSDHLGSATIMTNRDGDIVQHYGYNAYGSERYKNNTAAFDVTNRYTGQQIDEETGLYFYQSRYYDANLGRFTQADTVVPDSNTSQALNRYAYVANNPLKFSDPSGHGWFKDWFGTILSVALTIWAPWGSEVWWGSLAASAIGSGVGTIINGGNFKSFAIGFGISIAAGGIADGIGGAIGDTLGSIGTAITNAVGEGMAKILGKFAAGALTGAVAGALNSAVYGGKTLSNMLNGAKAGAIGTGVALMTSAVLRFEQAAETLKAIPGSGGAPTLIQMVYLAAMGTLPVDPNSFDASGDDDWNVLKLNETRDMIENLKKDWDPAWHSGGGDLDFKGSSLFFEVKIDGRLMRLSGSEFGNYLAGYMGTYHLGAKGYIAMRMYGNAYETEGKNWFSGDCKDSIRDIKRGARAAILENPIHFIFNHLPSGPSYKDYKTGYRSLRVLLSTPNDPYVNMP